MKRQKIAQVIMVFVLWLATVPGIAQEQGTWELRVFDEVGEPVACRVHLYDSENKPVRPPRSVFFRDHFVVDEEFALPLSVGEYRYEIERGHEYRPEIGEFTIESDEVSETRLSLERVADLKKLGWYSGDLHIHRPIEHVELLMRADDLHVGPVISWWNARNPWANLDVPEATTRSFDNGRFLDVMAGEDEREGGALLYFHLDNPLMIQEAAREFPSPMRFVREAYEENDQVWIDIEKPFWWDVPVWIASGRMHSIGIANNHMCRSSVLGNEAWGRPRDLNRFPGPHGNGLWTQEIYYQVLNTGHRFPPSAGSASGVLPNPVGFNRVYVYLDEDFTYESWWEGLAAGRSFVTNGPLLLVKANEQVAGHVFREPDKEEIQLDFKIGIISNESVTHLELIHNGDVVKKIELDDSHQNRTTVSWTASQSGWFLIRAMTDNEDTFRFASTAPFYLELGSQPKFISEESASFFCEWVDERIERVKANVPEGSEREQVLRPHAQAKTYWENMRESANAK